MDEFVTYVLYSASFEKIYIGYTSNLEKQLLSHKYLDNDGERSTKYKIKVKTISHRFGGLGADCGDNKSKLVIPILKLAAVNS